MFFGTRNLFNEIGSNLNALIAFDGALSIIDANPGSQLDRRFLLRHMGRMLQDSVTTIFSPTRAIDIGGLGKKEILKVGHMWDEKDEQFFSSSDIENARSRFGEMSVSVIRLDPPLRIVTDEFAAIGGIWESERKSLSQLRSVSSYLSNTQIEDLFPTKGLYQNDFLALLDWLDKEKELGRIFSRQELREEKPFNHETDDQLDGMLNYFVRNVRVLVRGQRGEYQLHPRILKMLNSEG